MFAKTTAAPAKPIAAIAGQTSDPYGPMRPFPAIGIRPTIDGRRNGVRESLEGQVRDWRTHPFDPHRIASYRTYPGKFKSLIGVGTPRARPHRRMIPFRQSHSSGWPAIRSASIDVPKSCG